MKLNKIKTTLLIAVLLLSMITVLPMANAAYSIGPVSPTDIPVGPAYTTLTGPLVMEALAAEIGIGTITLTAPAGFEFDTTASSVTATVSGLPTQLTLGAAPGAVSQTVTPTASDITIDVFSVSILQPSRITYTGIKIKATSTIPGATGSLDFSGTSLVTGSAGTLTSVLGPLDHFTMIGYPATCMATVPWTTPADNVIVTAYDAYDNVKTDYLGTVTWTSIDPAATLPAPYTFIGGDAGIHTFPGTGFTLATRGSQTIKVADGATTVTSNLITVEGGTLSIDTTPVKGVVFVNGVSWGVAPKSKDVAPGTYTVSFGAVSGYTKPAPFAATVVADQTLSVQGTYIYTGSGFSADNIDITNDNKPTWVDKGEKGHTIILEGDRGSVASGYEVSVYWDKIQNWDGVKGHLNTTGVDNDGGFEVWIKVPQSPVGTHYLWFTATDQETKVSKTFTVVSDCDISTSSGLAGSKIYVDLWGFAKDKEVAILFVEEGVIGQPESLDLFGESTSENLGETVDIDEDDYDGTLDKDMIVPGTFVLHISTFTFDDVKGANLPNGKIYSVAADEECGSINYVTGEWSIDLGDTAATETGVFSAVYDYFADHAGQFYVITSTGITNDLGSWEDKRMTIPDITVGGKYYIIGFDGKNNQANAGFTIGATITLSTDEGDVGDKIEVNGEGFEPSAEVTANLYKGTSHVYPCHIIGSAGTGTGTDKVDSDGEFEFYIIIPRASKKDDDYEIRITDGTNIAASDFEITGLADVSADPAFGPQGSSITVSGKNFQNIKDKKVKIMLYDDTTHIADIKDNVKVDADGSFKVTCTIPTENDDTYNIKVEDIGDTDGDFNIYDTVEFRIGTIMVLLSKDESIVGDKIVLSGNGFTKGGEWNATFGDVTIFSEEQASNTGLLRVDQVTPQFFVPQVQPGEYTITVWDVEAEISVETDFTVTEYTVLDFELLEAPNEFNISISGWNWPEVDDDINEEDEIEFVLWNETDDWEMDVMQLWDDDDNPDTEKALRAAPLNGTGFLNYAWWVVPDSDTLDKGKYWVNATIETTNDQEYFMQFEFVIGDIHLYSAPRKATFRIGETVSFKIQHTFGNDKAQDIWGGDIKVYDPDGTLYWDGDKLETWSKVGTWYESPTSSQVASGNPMMLLDDAPLGTWTYKWRDKTGEVIAEGTFKVEASEADVFGARIDDLNSAIDDLTNDISAVTDAVAGVQSNVNNAVQAANAAVDAANKAIEAVNAVAGTASEAATAANKAAAAAEKAQDSASSLTTLVYGAIGASLVAALAAIVSLMQISKRIAG